MGTGPSTLQPPQQDDGNSSPTAVDETTWMPDNNSDICLVCGEAFTLFNRRHHCRHCQKLVCSACSSRKLRFDSGVSGRAGPKRVCKDCFLVLVAEQEQVLVGRDAASLESGEYVHFKVVLHEIVGKIIKKADKETPPQDLEDSRDVDKVSPDTGCSKIFCSPTSPRRDDPQREETTMEPSSHVLKLARAPHCRLTVAGKEVGKTNPVEAEQDEDAAAERCSFNEAFFFRVSCGSRNADYIVLEVFDGGNLLGRCRVPIFRTPRDMDGIFWHVLLKVDGAPGAVGRVLVTVRNLGAGSIRRPAWDHCIPGGCQVTAPTDLTPPPDNPLLEEFFRRDSEMHNSLFFRFGENDEEFLPFNERTLEILPRVCMCPLVHHTSDDTAGPEGRCDKDDSNISTARADSWNSMESFVSDTLPEGLEGLNPSVSASRAKAGWRGGTSEGVSPSSAGWSDSWDNSVSLRGKGRSRSFLNRSAVSMVVNGALVLTTHRVLFVGERRGEARKTLVEMPLAFITKMRVEYRLRKGLISLQIYCRDRKKMHFVIRKTVNQTWISVTQSVRRFEEEIKWLAGEDNFAHSSDTRRVKASLDKGGLSLALSPDLKSCLDDNPLDVTSEYTRGFPSDYHPAREHVRQGVDKGKDWRQSKINCSFTLCSTYGRHLVIPSAMESSAVEKAFKARSRNRIPALTWLHPRTRAALCRSSQPILGINPTQSLLDDAHDILKVIQMTTTLPLVSPSRAHSRSTSLSGSPISITAKSPVPVENEPWSLRGKAYLSGGADSLNDLMDLSLSTEGNNDNVSEKDSERADTGVPSAEAGQGDPLQEKPIITEGLFETLEEKDESPLESSAGTVGADTIGGGDNPPAASFIVNSERHPEAGLAGDLEEYDAGDNQIGNACLIKDREDEGSAAAGDLTRLAQSLIEQRSISSGGEANQKQSPRIVLVAAPAGAEALAIEEIEEEREAIEGELEGGPEEVDSDRVNAMVSTVPSVQGTHSAHSIPNTIVLEVPAAGLAAVANGPPRLFSGPASPSTGGRGSSRTRRIVGSGVNTANASRHPWNRANSESNLKPDGRRRMPVLRILDGRSMLLAKYHQVRGMGHEDTSRLGGERESSMAFLDIPNKKGVQKSFAALVEACCLREDDPAWLLHVHNSRWLEHISALLKGASIVCTHLEAGDPVLVHCSDGWDRTPQITALAQLMLDPYYRTIRGFQVLVEKDWCGFGHQFATRGGHGQNPVSRTAPIFPQFLDATYQLLRQYPESFEFSENLLILLMHAYYSRWFNNFLHDSEHERVLAYARSSLSKVSGGDSTVSLWTHVEFCRERYENVLWNTGQNDPFSDTSPLWPAYGVRHLVFWEGAWAGRGLQHPGCGWLNNAGSTMEDALLNLVQEQQSIIKMLRFGREADGTVTPVRNKQK